MNDITIVGAGFLGSHIVEEVSKLLFSQSLFHIGLRIIDFDTWEERNAANQNVTVVDARAGLRKAETCARIATDYNIRNVAIIDRITMDNAATLLADSQLIIDCVDNIPTRQILWALASGGVTAPCVHVGLSRKGDGMVNWSSKIFDTFPFRPDMTAGRDLVNQDEKELACQMYKYRSYGIVTVHTAIKAIAFFLGVDPWNFFGQGTETDRGLMSCWTVNEKGPKIHAEGMYLRDDFFPIYREDNPEEVLQEANTNLPHNEVQELQEVKE